MTARIVAWCTRHPVVVLVLALALGAGGELARRSLARDVIPDLSDPQVVLVADWMGVFGKTGSDRAGPDTTCDP